MDSGKIIYWGSRLDRISDNLNMLFNNYNIDFDLILKRVSNISFHEDTFQILPYPSLLDELQKINNLKITITQKMDNLTFPCLVGNINKKNIFGRIEKVYFKQEIDFILFLEEKNDRYLVYDSDIAPYLLISKEKLKRNISDEKIIIEVTNYNINYSEKEIYINNVKNLKHGELIGSNAYFKIANIVKNKKITSKNETSLYYSIRNLSILTYKMLKLAQNFTDNRYIYLLGNELELFDRLLNFLSKREKKSVIYNELFALANNRVKMESLFEK